MKTGMKKPFDRWSSDRALLDSDTGEFANCQSISILNNLEVGVKVN
jgi:hypothetical protein